MLDYIWSSEDESKAKQVLNKLDTNVKPQAIYDAIDRALEAEYLEGKKVGELGTEEEAKKFYMIFATMLLTCINTIILSLWKLGYI